MERHSGTGSKRATDERERERGRDGGREREREGGREGERRIEKQGVGGGGEREEAERE